MQLEVPNERADDVDFAYKVGSYFFSFDRIVWVIVELLTRIIGELD